MAALNLDYATFKSLISGFRVYYIAADDGSYNLYTFPTRNDSNYCIISSPADIADFDATVRPSATEVSTENEAAALAIQANASQPAPVQLFSGAGASTPTTSDGRSIVLSNLFPDYVFLYFAGAGDDVALGRGNGPEFYISSDVAGDSYVEFYFNDWVYVAGGSIKCQGAQIGDHISFGAYAPATPVTPNGSGTGNCNLAPAPGGGPNVLIVPAPGNGTYDVDLSQAVPINAFSTTEPRVPVGYWDWSTPPTGLGVVTASSNPGHANYNLFSISFDPMIYFIRKFQLLGDGEINLTIPAIAPKTFLPQWRQRVTVHNSGHAGLKVIWRVVTARVKSTG